MKRKHIIFLLTVVVVIIIVFYGFRGSQYDPGYVEHILKEREERDRFMLTSRESPFYDDKESFKGLAYFPPDPRYRIIADLVPIREKKRVTLTTNDGREQRYIEYAYAEFDFDQFHNRLLIFEVADMGPMRGKLFLPFGDATSGDETYGAGRYLDLEKAPVGSATITLDFNLSYNPYCAYDDSYSCPLPPAENLLRAAIRAGEKNFK